jgi:hypothetical protein
VPVVGFIKAMEGSVVRDLFLRASDTAERSVRRMSASGTIDNEV